MPLSKIQSNSILDGAVVAAKIADGTITTADLASSSVTAAKLAGGAVNPSAAEDMFELCYGLCDGSRTLRQLCKVACGGPNSDDNHSIYWQWDCAIVWNKSNSTWYTAEGNAHVVYPSGSAFICARTGGLTKKNKFAAI